MQRSRYGSKESGPSRVVFYCRIKCTILRGFMGLSFQESGVTYGRKWLQKRPFVLVVAGSGISKPPCRIKTSIRYRNRRGVSLRLNALRATLMCPCLLWALLLSGKELRKPSASVCCYQSKLTASSWQLKAGGIMWCFLRKQTWISLHYFPPVAQFLLIHFSF